MSHAHAAKPLTIADLKAVFDRLPPDEFIQSVAMDVIDMAEHAINVAQEVQQVWASNGVSKDPAIGDFAAKNLCHYEMGFGTNMAGAADIGRGMLDEAIRTKDAPAALSASRMLVFTLAALAKTHSSLAFLEAARIQYHGTREETDHVHDPLAVTKRLLDTLASPSMMMDAKTGEVVNPEDAPSEVLEKLRASRQSNPRLH